MEILTRRGEREPCTDNPRVPKERTPARCVGAHRVTPNLRAATVIKNGVRSAMNRTNPPPFLPRRACKREMRVRGWQQNRKAKPASHVRPAGKYVRCGFPREDRMKVIHLGRRRALWTKPTVTEGEGKGGTTGCRARWLGRMGDDGWMAVSSCQKKKLGSNITHAALSVKSGRGACVPPSILNPPSVASNKPGKGRRAGRNGHDPTEEAGDVRGHDVSQTSDRWAATAAAMT